MMNIRKQVDELVAKGYEQRGSRKRSAYYESCPANAVDWEAGKPDVIELWKKMNSWVYEGFDETYKRIGSDFDKDIL